MKSNKFNNYNLISLGSIEMLSVDGGAVDPPASCFNQGADDAAQGKPFDESCNGTAYFWGYCMMSAIKSWSGI